LNRTQAVWLREGVVRDETKNSNTVWLTEALSAYFDGAPHPGAPAPPRSFRDRFLACYGRVKELCDRATGPSLALVAIDGAGVAASALLAARSNRCTAAVVGRHSMADLYLPGDPTLSLRHLAVVVHPLRRESDDVRFHLLDLRTSSAFADENGRRLEAIEVEGPVFASCARYALFLLPCDDGLPWPERGVDAWDCLPARVYLDDVLAEPDRWTRRRMRAGAPVDDPRRAGAQPDPGNRRPTWVVALGGPTPARQRMLAEDEQALGELRITSADGTGAIVVGRTALREGVLLGRAPRCDTGPTGLLTSREISRVHLLVMEVDNDLYAIDTASTHGVWLDGERVSIARLTFGTRLILDASGTQVEWRALN
jgi:hypothetical protein